jgi:hypothetical protein
MTKIREARVLSEAADEQEVALRFLGGAAIAIHCEREQPHREYSDLDAVTRRRDVRSLTRVLESREYEPDKRFNAVNARTRLVFYGPSGKLDVFVDEFEMCHRIALAHRLDIDRPTLSVTDLLLTKLQVVEMNDKDVVDLTLLLESHEIASGEGDHVNSEYFGELLGSDWGLWKTVSISLGHLRGAVPALGKKLTELESLAESAPRSLRFKMRGMVGERTKWYEEPEEVGEDT